MNGWFFYEEIPNGTGSFVSGPLTPPAGTGSVRLTGDATGRMLIGTLDYAGTRFDELTNLEYGAYQVPGTGPSLAISMQMDVDYDLTDGDTSWQGRLVFEPYFTGTVVHDVWQTWTPLGGNWWASGAPGNSVCSQSTPCSFADVMTNFPDAGLRATDGILWFKVGGPWPTGFDGNVDNFTIGVNSVNTTYDFEPETACTTTCYVDAATGDDSFGGDTPASAKQTIQAAVDQVSSGGTVNVAAGTYIENLLVDKPLALTGAGQGSSFVYPAVSNPNACGGASLCGGVENIILVQADDVTISGFTLDGDNTGLTSGVEAGGADLDARNGIIANYNAGTFNNLEVHHVTVNNIYLRGIYASSGGTFNFHDNIVDNVQGEAASIAMFNFGGSGIFEANTVSNANDAIASNWSSGTQYLDNVVTASGSGIHTDNNGGSGGTADYMEGNNVSDCAPGGYGMWVFATYRAVTVHDNAIDNCAVGLSIWGGFAPVTTTFSSNVVTGAFETEGVGAYITTDLISYGYTDVYVDFTDNTITGHETGVYLTADEQTWNPVTWTDQTISATFTGNKIFDNGMGMDKGTDGTYNPNAENNWWGAAAGPGPVGPSTANGIAAGIPYSPWWATADGSVTLSQNPDGHIAVPDTTPVDVVQAVISSSAPGTVVELGAGTFSPPGGFVLDAPGVTLQLSPGTVIQPSSPCFTVSADNLALLGGVCEPSSGSDGIVTGAAVSNLIIRGMEIRDGTGAGDGIHLAHDVHNLQVLDNYIHDMAGDGLEYVSSTTVSGVHEVQGNLFQSNGGSGVNNATGNSYNVEYNSWGHLDGPDSGGDGASGPLDYTPWTHVALSMASSGSPVADKVGFGEQITYTISMDAAQAYAADFDLAFDNSLLEVVSITNALLFSPTPPGCVVSTVGDANTSGVISFCGSSTSAVNGPALTVYTVVFEGLNDGPVALDFDEGSDAFGMAPPGGASNNIYAHALTDGSVTVYPAFTVTGRVDLQGRADDSGAVMTFAVGQNQGYGPFVFSTSDYWGEISAGGVFEDTYDITVTMARYLDVTLGSGISVAIDSLKDTLETLVLLGGDVTGDNEIRITDAAIIGGEFGHTGGSIGDVNADINNDNVVNILDLVLVGGNFDLTSATAYTGYVP